MITEHGEREPSGKNSELAECCEVLSACFLFDPRDESAEDLFNHLAVFPFVDAWPYGQKETLESIETQIRKGQEDTEHPLAREYQRLFIGPEHFAAPAWGSVYLDRECVLFGCSTLELRKWMRLNGITYLEDTREPEDHIGRMLNLLGWLFLQKPELVAEYLSEHLMTWAPRYLELLEEDAHNPFYRGIARLTSLTLVGIMDEFDLEARTRKIYF